MKRPCGCEYRNGGPIRHCQRHLLEFDMDALLRHNREMRDEERRRPAVHTVWLVLLAVAALLLLLSGCIRPSPQPTDVSRKYGPPPDGKKIEEGPERDHAEILPPPLERSFRDTNTF